METNPAPHIAKLPYLKTNTLDKNGEDYWLKYPDILQNEYVASLFAQALSPDDRHSKMTMGAVFLPNPDEPHSQERISPALIIERFDRKPGGRTNRNVRFQPAFRQAN